jgi:hypothetical protein
MSNEEAREQLRASLSMPVGMPLPFNPRHMLSVSPRGVNNVNESYVPQHDIINCVPGAFVAMCTLIQNVDGYVAEQVLKISEPDMEKAVLALRYVLSREGLSHATPEEAYLASGFADLPWESRTWVLKNLGDVMVRMWHQAAIARVSNFKEYMDSPVNQAAENMLRKGGRGLG